MRVLIACEFSGVVRDAFLAFGHDAWSCDLLPSDRPGPHVQCDVLTVLDDGWDLMIAHPPCTRLCNSGVSWLDKRDLWRELDDAAAFFSRLLGASIDMIAVENPIPHRYATDRIGRKYDQLLQPWQFGHGETKATCLWLKHLPPLRYTRIVHGRTAKLHRLPPSEHRWKMRSTTYSGIADAMATQWGKLAIIPPQE